MGRNLKIEEALAKEFGHGAPREGSNRRVGENRGDTTNGGFELSSRILQPDTGESRIELAFQMDRERFFMNSCDNSLVECRSILLKPLQDVRATKVSVEKL